MNSHTLPSASFNSRLHFISIPCAFSLCSPQTAKPPPILSTSPAFPPYPLPPHAPHPLSAPASPMSPTSVSPALPGAWCHTHPASHPTLLLRPSTPGPSVRYPATHAAPHSCSGLLTPRPAGAHTVLSPRAIPQQPKQPLEPSGQLLFTRSHTGTAAASMPPAPTPEVPLTHPASHSSEPAAVPGAPSGTRPLPVSPSPRVSPWPAQRPPRGKPAPFHVEKWHTQAGAAPRAEA